MPFRNSIETVLISSKSWPSWTATTTTATTTIYRSIDLRKNTTSRFYGNKNTVIRNILLNDRLTAALVPGYRYGVVAIAAVTIIMNYYYYFLILFLRVMNITELLAGRIQTRHVWSVQTARNPTRVGGSRFKTIT